MNDNNDKISKLNKKFNNVMAKLEKYNGTDPESIVQQAYNKYFQAYFKLDDTSITRVEKCDSYFIKDKLVVLAEYKFNVDFSDTLTRAKVIAQSLIYYKKIVDKGKDTIPNVVFIGDVNECFCFKAKHFSKHMSHDEVDYSVAASSAGSQMKLVQAIADDVELQNDIFIINPQKDPMSYICEKMAAMSFDKDAKIPITLKNVTRVFEAFSTKICVDKKYSSNEMVGLFIDAIRYPEKRIIGGDYLVVPPYKPMKVDMMKTIGLFKFFGKPSDAEAKELTRIYDQLVKDSDRRMHGFFATPSLWSDLGHKYVADYFKKIGFIEDGNWEGSDKIVCWDCCCGTKSLTRDFRFANLYLSTLEQSELNASVDLSPEAKETFVFDFLNDPISKLPESLKNELQNLRHTDKKLCFFINPPYGQSKAQSRMAATNTITRRDMHTNDFGKASQELLTQFMFRINELAKSFKFKPSQLVLAMFARTTFMSGDAFKEFREYLHKSNHFDSGFLFNAGEFENVSDGWAISFSIWVNEKMKADPNGYLHDIYENDLNLTKIGTKYVYNLDTDNMTFNDWLRIGLTKYDYAYTTNDGIKLDWKDTPCKTKWSSKILGVFDSNGLNLKNAKFVHLCTFPNPINTYIPITHANFNKCIAGYSARMIIRDGNWTNHLDSFKAPTITNDDSWNIFVSDSLIFCIIDSSFIQHRSFSINGIAYDYKNNFFPFSKAETYKLLGQELMKNEVDEKRWCLANGKFDNPSPEGKTVLDAFAACIKASAPFRREFGQSHPELQLDHWDAGYRQMRELFKTACPEELKAFKAALKALKTKLAPMVYELGFLRK